MTNEGMHMQVLEEILKRTSTAVLKLPCSGTYLTHCNFLYGMAYKGVICNFPGFVGYLAVYRICFVVTLFFLLMAVIMIGVRSSRDPRGVIQNG